MRGSTTRRLGTLIAAVALLAGCAGDPGDTTGPGAEPTAPGTGQPIEPSVPPGEPGEDDGDDGGGAGPVEPGDAGDGTRLTIEVDATGEGTTTTWTLGCDPVDGDHPDAEAACAALAESGAGAFAPVPADQMCTQIYGGPQVAEVTGTVDGTAVAATFSRENGCEIARWDALEPVLGTTTGVGAEVTE